MLSEEAWVRTRAGPDRRALRIVRGLAAWVKEGGIILFGSRARCDWNDYSDVDLLIVVERIPDKATQHRLQNQAYRLAEQEFGDAQPPMEFVYLTQHQYRNQVRHSVNGIGAIAYREGIKMGHLPDVPEDPESHPKDDREERNRRIGDANKHYATMQSLIDADQVSGVCAYCAHQVLEHAFKALIAAKGERYASTHTLTDLAHHAWPQAQWQSDLAQLNAYAGGLRYRPPPAPVMDFKRMTNAITTDLERIYERIEALTGEIPWQIKAPDYPRAIRPRYR